MPQLLLLTAIISLVIAKESTAEEPETLCPSERILVAAPEEAKLRHLAWPKLVKAQNGTLVLTYSAGIGHNQGSSGLAVSLSHDDGATFTPPKVLAYFPEDDPRYKDCGNMALGVAPDGSIVLLAMAFAADQHNTIIGFRSTDHGSTWNRIDTTSLSENKTGSVFGQIFSMPNGRLVVSGHYRLPKGSGIWLAYSEDQGKSWGSPQTVTQDKFFEPTFLYSGQRLIGLVRENDAHAFHQFTSDDLGESWSFQKSVIQGNVKAVHPSPCLMLDPLDSTRLLALQTERTAQKEIYLWVANVDDLKWKRGPKLVSCPESEDFGYPWMTHLEDDNWFLVYYAGKKSGESSIYGKRIQISGR